MNFQPASCCRICLKTELLMSIYIYSPTFLMRPIEMIEKLHIFKTQPDDHLPTVLCQSCLYRLLDAYNLQQLAEASERRLREYLCTTNNGTGSSCILTSNSITPESTSFCSATAMPESAKDADATTAIYANICDMFERNVQSQNIDVDGTTATADDVLNDVEIDVSSLTRSEANDDTLTEVLVAGHIDIDYDDKNSGLCNAAHPQHEDYNKFAKLKPIAAKNCHQQALVNTKVSEQCLNCGKVFNYVGYLEAHRRTHTGEKPFTCQHCPRSFSQSSNLLLHQRTHTGERRFQCEICARLFTTSSNLKAHKATHLEQKDYQCLRCARCFKSARELRRHEPVHKSTKDHVCEQCSKAFSKRSYLHTHVAVMHRDFRRHKCNECAKEFGSRSNLVCHMRIHTGEKPFRCKYCPWKFSQSSALMRHLKKHIRSKTFDTNLKTAEDSAFNDNAQIHEVLQNTKSMETLPSNFLTSQSSSGVSPSINISAMRRINDTNLSTVESQFQSFTKDTILDFSVSQQQPMQTQSLY